MVTIIKFYDESVILGAVTLNHSDGVHLIHLIRIYQICRNRSILSWFFEGVGREEEVAWLAILHLSIIGIIVGTHEVHLSIDLDTT